MKLLENLTKIHAPSGEEYRMKAFLLDYLEQAIPTWKNKPQLLHGPAFQDCLILTFGQPRTAIFAHMDSVGFMVRYANQLIPIGGPHAETGYVLTGEDSLGPVRCTLRVEEDQLYYEFGRGIERGTTLVFEPNFQLTETTITSPFLDNRLGMYSALKVAEGLEHGAIVFSSYEEHGGGSVPILVRYLFEELGVTQALVSDITWVTEGVRPGEGVVVSMRDRNIPRKPFLDRIRSLADEAGISYQLEVEQDGSSDGRELQLSPYPIDWCFIGAPEDHVHSPIETVNRSDFDSMINLYRHLMAKL